jgi:hypothetical protein
LKVVVGGGGNKQGWSAGGGAPTAHNQKRVRQFEMHLNNIWPFV